MNNKLTLLCSVLALSAGVHRASAQNTVFTYQGQLLDNGTAFTGLGQFEFALVYPTNTSSQARAEVNAINDTAIKDIYVINGGSGYVTPPAVTLQTTGSSGSGAILTAVINSGIVTAIHVVAGGTNYSSQVMDFIVEVAPPPANYTNLTLWNNDGTADGEPIESVPIPVTNGLFTVILGDTALPNMTAIPATLLSQYAYPNLQLQIWFNDRVHGFAALNPTQPLTPAPTAAFANTASNLLGTLPTSQLTGTLAGNGSGLTAVPAGSLTGTLADGLLSANVALRTGGNAFTGNQTITSGNVGLSLASTAYAMEMTSNGVAHMTLDSSGNLECSGTVYSHGMALTSDRNLKEHFQPLDGQAVLAKIAALPVSEWNYKEDSRAVQHIGPMAQDFHAAFGLDGADDKHISVVDEGGVALAAIQGLNRKLQEEVSRVRAENAELKQRLDKLEQRMNQNNGKE